MARGISRSGLRSFGSVMEQWVMPICVCWIMLFPSLASGAGIKSELLHREHQRSPLRSVDHLSHFEKTKLDVQRSVARARILTESIRKNDTAAGEDLMSVSSFGQGAMNALASSPTSDSPDVRFEASLSNVGQSEYLMSVSLGTPPQLFTVIADTGSDLNWLQCEPCVNCYDQKDAPFQPNSSSNFQSMSCTDTGCSSFLATYGSAVVVSCDSTTDVTDCEYLYKYAGGSNTSGSFSTETINLTGMDGESVAVPNFWFGCSHNTLADDGSFASGKVDGLFGFGQNSISFSSQIGRVVENQFSYCLVNASSAKVLSSRLVIGDDTGLPEMDLKLQYTPFTGPGHYYVTVEGITVAGVEVDFNKSVLQLDANNQGGMVFDSGTTFIYLSSVVFDPLVTAIAAQTPSDFATVSVPELGLQLCYRDDAGLAVGAFPTIGFQFAGATVSWDLPFENVWERGQISTDGSVAACLLIVREDPGSTLGGVTASIFGNRAQQNFYVLHDGVNGQIGFAPADCGTVSPDRAAR